MTVSAAALILSGCMSSPVLPPVSDTPARAAAAPPPPAPSAESQKLATYYSRVEKGL